MEYNVDDIKKSKPNQSFEFICKNCGCSFYRTKRDISKNKYELPMFCSCKCRGEWKSKNRTVNVKCKYCGKEFKILLSDYNRSKTKHFFCCQSHSASYTNRYRNNDKKMKDVVWKGGKHKKGYNACPRCGKLKSYTAELCRKCCIELKHEKIKLKTLGYYIDGHKYLTIKCSEIRKDARRTIENSNKVKHCCFCGNNHEFDEILDVHHIKGILKFPSSATIGEINNIDNLMWVCPSHHKMLEKGLITLTP